MPITIRQIAEAAGVSVATVSRVLNRSAHPVHAETSQRVLAIATQLGYRPNYMARGLRTDRTHIIGVVTDDITGLFTPPMVRALQDRLQHDGYHCVIINADRDPARQEEAVRELLAHGVDGVVFVESWHHSVTSLLTEVNKPYVYVHRQFDQTFYPSVVPDELYNARLAVRHLIQLGHRRIGYINGPTNYYVSAMRLEAYQYELALAGITLDAQLVLPGDWQLATGYRAMQMMLRLAEPPSAIFAANDMMAAGAIYAIQDANLSVPADIAVVGYDNREVAVVIRPALTTVTLPCYEMGKRSAELLLQLLNQPEEATGVTGREEIKVRGHLIVRDSCGGSGQCLPTKVCRPYS